MSPSRTAHSPNTAPYSLHSSFEEVSSQSVPHA
jgi:hypothetical protein